MTQVDQLKLLKAGFTIIRPMLMRRFDAKKGESIHIKAKTKEWPEWHILEKDFVSNAAMERRIKELLQNEKIVNE